MGPNYIFQPRILKSCSVKIFSELTIINVICIAKNFFFCTLRFHILSYHNKAYINMIYPALRWCITGFVLQGHACISILLLVNTRTTLKGTDRFLKQFQTRTSTRHAGFPECIWVGTLSTRISGEPRRWYWSASIRLWGFWAAACIRYNLSLRGVSRLFRLTHASRIRDAF